MTHALTKTLTYDSNLGSSDLPDASATDLVMIHTITDASVDNGEALALHGKKLFDTSRPAEPVTLKDWEIIKIAYRSERQGGHPHDRYFVDRQGGGGPVHHGRRAVPEES